MATGPSHELVPPAVEAEELFGIDLAIALVVGEETKRRLDCLRALKISEQHTLQRPYVLSRLAGIASGENIPNELVASIFGYLSQDMRPIALGSGQDDKVAKVCAAMLGASTAAETLQCRLEQAVVENVFLSVRPQLLLSIPAIHDQVCHVRHLQLTVTVNTKYQYGFRGFCYIPDSKEQTDWAVEALRSIGKAADRCFARLQAINLQLVFVTKPDQTRWRDWVVRCAIGDDINQGRFEKMFDEILAGLIELQAQVLKKKGMRLRVTVQQKLHLTKWKPLGIYKYGAGALSDVLEGAMVDIDGKEKQQILREGLRKGPVEFRLEDEE